MTAIAFVTVWLIGTGVTLLWQCIGEPTETKINDPFYAVAIVSYFLFMLAWAVILVSG